MRRIFGLLGATLAGAVGWSLGRYIGLGTALVLSCIGSGAGLYWGYRLFDHWLG